MRPFHPQYIITALLDVLSYLWVTLATMAATVLFGGLVGLLLACAQIKRGKIASALAQVYIHYAMCAIYRNAVYRLLWLAGVFAGIWD